MHVALVIDVDRGARVRVDGRVTQRDVDFGVSVVVEAQVAVVLAVALGVGGREALTLHAGADAHGGGLDIESFP